LENYSAVLTLGKAEKKAYSSILPDCVSVYMVEFNQGSRNLGAGGNILGPLKFHSEY